MFTVMEMRFYSVQLDSCGLFIFSVSQKKLKDDVVREGHKNAPDAFIMRKVSLAALSFHHKTRAAVQQACCCDADKPVKCP